MYITYAIHSDKESAQSELNELNSIFGLPDSKKGTAYSVIEQFNEGWRFKIKTEGIYKADHIVSNTQQFEIKIEEEL